MSRRRILTVALLTVFAAACQDTSDPMVPPSPDLASVDLRQQAERVVPGRVLARLTDPADADDLALGHGVELERRGAAGRFSIFRGAVGNERALAARLARDVRVVWAEPDYLRQTTAIDPRLWAFDNPGNLTVTFTSGRNKGRVVGSLVSVADADEDNPEGYGAGGQAVAIASIDTGVEFGHPEFAGLQVVPGWDFFDDDPDPSDTDDHGTHTSGTMVGNTVGVAGVAGASPNVTLYVYRVCGAIGCPTSAIVDAILAATDAGVVAMNLSLGGGSLAQAEAEAIDYATAHDALVIASAGNGGTGTVSCPACDPDAISVAASDWLDQHAYYTNWGPGLDITAPGGEMYSNTTPEAGIWSSVRGGYAYFQGTSMAAPQVTGTAAVVASVRGVRGAALRARLEGTADDLGDPGYDQDFGNGRLNSYRAVTGSDLGGGTPPPPPASLSASFSVSCQGGVCDFDGGSSTGSITSYTWGGAFSATGVRVTHTFTAQGSYLVTLTVRDGSGAQDSATQTVDCSVRGKSLRCR